MSILEIQSAAKSYENRSGSVDALAEVDLRVARGEFVALVGKSGCGKSTLLNMVAGFAKPDRGRVLFAGMPVTGPNPKRLLMAQDPALFPWLDVLGNVMYGLKLTRKSDKERLDTAHRYLSMVGLERFERSFVHELSGGMQQRTALARSLAPNPDLILMDEPFSALDALTREQLYADLQHIWAENDKTILLVTHNVREAVCLADRVLVLAPSPGRIVSEFVVNLPRPRTLNDPSLTQLAADVSDALATAGKEGT